MHDVDRTRNRVRRYVITEGELTPRLDEDRFQLQLLLLPQAFILSLEHVKYWTRDERALGSRYSQRRVGAVADEITDGTRAVRR